MTEVGLKARRSAPSSPPPPGPDALRTFALAGHRSAGKTSLAEMLLQAGRVVREPGEVASGTTLLDWSACERRYRQTIELSTAWFDWNGLGVQLLDTPGATCLGHARDLALECVEAAVVVIDAGEGLEVGTEEAFRTAARVGLPVIVVLTKIDRVGELPDLDEIGKAAGMRAVPVQLPFHEDGRLAGLVDVLGERALRFADDGAGTWSPEPLPERLRAGVAAAREVVTEAIAVTDDALLEQYLEYLELPLGTVRQALTGAVHRRAVAPVFVVSSAARIGAGPLLDALVELVPPLGAVRRDVSGPGTGDRTRAGLAVDGPFVARILSEHRDDDGETWHLLRVLAGTPPRSGEWIEGDTGRSHRIRKSYRVRGPRRQALSGLVPGLVVGTWDPLPAPAGTTLTAGERWQVVGTAPRPPMMALALRPEETRHRAKLEEALAALVRADRGLELHDPGDGAVLLAGTDESHLKLSLGRLEAWTGLKIQSELPPVGYVEMPAAPIEGVEGLHLREDGDGLVAEYGRCELAIDPYPTDHGFDWETTHDSPIEFEDTLGDVEDDLPRRFRPAVDEGARVALRHGPTAGYPVVGLKLKLTGGAYDMLQSTDDHFRLAAERAVRVALERAGTRILEPWRQVDVVTPSSALGDVINDIAAHRGRILGMQVEGDTARLVASSPYRELRTFAPRLQTLTGGRGRFESRATHYEPVPSFLLDEAIRSSPFRVSGRPLPGVLGSGSER